MGLIILQLHGHAPYGKHHCVSSLCGVVRQAGSWHSPQASTVSFLWLAWMVRWWKMEITSGPTAPARFCPWEPHLFKKRLFYVMGPGLIFCVHFYAYLGKWVWILSEYKAKTVCSRCYFTALQFESSKVLSVLICLGWFFFLIGFTSRVAGNKTFAFIPYHPTTLGPILY